MIHVRDQDFNSQSRDAFGEAFLTHTSTSPNQQLLASLDLARRQVDIEGFQMVRYVYDMALVFRHRVRKDRLISKWFRILDESDLVPDEFRLSAVSSYRQVRQGALADWNEAWRSDQFVLDPTRVTLYVGRTGMNGYDFREKILMDRFGIQINKTSINSVLLIFTIGVTWSSVHYLLDVLRRVATDFDRTEDAASRDDRALHRRRVEEITEDLPPLPDFSQFDNAFRPDDASSFGDMRSAFYAATRTPIANTSCSGRRADGSPTESLWYQPDSWCLIRRASRCWCPVSWCPSRSCISLLNSMSRRFTDTTPISGCRCSPRTR
jgi:arginine decarboxylase